MAKFATHCLQFVIEESSMKTLQENLFLTDNVLINHFLEIPTEIVDFLDMFWRQVDELILNLWTIWLKWFK